MVKITDKFKIMCVSQKHFLKGIENIVQNLDLSKPTKSVSIPILCYDIILECKNKSLFVSELSNRFYNKIKHLNYYYISFSEFIRNAILDYILSNKKINDIFIDKKKIIGKNDNIFYIEDKKYVIVKKLINPN